MSLTLHKCQASRACLRNVSESPVDILILLLHPAARCVRAQEGEKLWTYSAERNSGCFPLLEREVQLDRQILLLLASRE